MSATRFLPLALAASALVLPATATADPVETNTPSVVCTASVYVGGGSFRHGDHRVTVPALTVRLADHTGALGEQDPCAA